MPRRVALHDPDLVAGTGVPGQLDLPVVLVAPEPWHRRVRLGLLIGGQQPPCGMAALLDRVVPVFHPERHPGARVGPTGHVAGRRHVRSGQARPVADDPVVEGESGALQPIRVGHHADAHDDQVGTDDGPVGQFDLQVAGTARHPGDADAAAQVHPVGRVHVGDDGAHLLAEHPTEGRRQGLHHRHGDAPANRDRRHLGADEPRPHDDQPAGAAVEGIPDGEAVVERAERVDAGHPLGARQDAAAGSGRDQQPVVGLGHAVDLEFPGSHVEASGSGPEAQVEIERLELLGWRQERAVDVPIAGQQLLRERRPVVGQVGLVADEPDRPFEAVTAQRLGGPQASQRRPDDRDRPAHGPPPS